MGRRKSRSRSRRRNKARSSSSPSCDGDEKSREEVRRGKGGHAGTRSAADHGRRADRGSNDHIDTANVEDMSLEAKLALLEVDNETLKAENRELRKKLVEALRRPVSKPGDGEDRERAKRSVPAKIEEPARSRDDAGELSRRRHREEPGDTEEVTGEEGEDGEPPQNAVLLANAAMEIYNEMPIPNNIPPEKRLPLVQQKMDLFLKHFSEKAQIIDLKSDKAIFKDRKAMAQRYGCVFRESGARLQGTCNKRFYYDAPPGKPTYVLDFETHASLVTATAGTPQDGKLGVREPRTEHLIVLYEERHGKFTRMWLKQDADKLGLDTYAGEDIIMRSEAFKAFEAKIAALKGDGAGGAGERFFNNYHNIPTVG